MGYTACVAREQAIVIGWQEQVRERSQENLSNALGVKVRQHDGCVPV